MGTEVVSILEHLVFWYIMKNSCLYYDDGLLTAKSMDDVV